MIQRIRTIQAWWTADIYRPVVFGVSLLFAWFIGQGIPYWDGDFDMYFKGAFERTLPQLLWGWISPVYQGPGNWGFQDRPPQFMIYKLVYRFAGYHSWPIWIFKDLCYAGLCLMIYQWVLLVAPGARKAALGAAIFFLVAPGPVAAHVWLSDFGSTAELCLAALTYIIWQWLEAEPGPSRERWIALAFVVYLAYKTKADLKVIPLVISGYVLLLRRDLWKRMALPVAIMLVLAVPWSSSTLTKLPPFIPGSTATAEGYSPQTASLSMMISFLWSTEPYLFAASLREGPTSLSGLLGPFLLGAIAVFIGWLMISTNYQWDPPEWTRPARARVFVGLWLAVILAASSILPQINPYFRTRWTIATLAPACVLLGWALAVFADHWTRMPRWLAYGGLALCAAQLAVNLNRSILHRRDLGQVMGSIDQAYSYIDQNYPDGELYYWAGFLPYAYHEQAGKAFQHAQPLGNPAGLPPGPAPKFMVGWKSAPTPFPVVQRYDGCQGTSLFERLIPCVPEVGTVVMRYDPSTAPVKAAAAADYLDQSLAFYRNHQNRECIAAAREALKLNPHLAEAYNNIAAAYAEMHQWDEAIAAAIEAIRLKPDFQLAKNNLNWAAQQRALQKSTGKPR